jgi:hypothetical protein
LDQLHNAVTVEVWLLFQRKRRNGHLEVCVLSQGSWEGRFKLSILPTGRIRWTVRTQAGDVVDCDGKSTIQFNRWYHAAAVYDTGRMELYLNGASDIGGGKCSKQAHGPLAGTGGRFGSITVLARFTILCLQTMTSRLGGVQLTSRARSTTEDLWAR